MFGSMVLHWGYNVTFLWKQFKTDDDDPLFYFIGLIVCVLLEILSTFLQSRQSSSSDKVIKGVLKGVVYLLQILAMLLAMTYNYGVIISLVVGHTVGYILFNEGGVLGK